MGLVLFCWVAAFATCAIAAPGGPQTERHCSPQNTSQFAIADFDGDSRPDLAAVESEPPSSFHTRYRIAFQLSSGSRRTLGITAPVGGLQIASRDVNGDDFPDVVITTAWTNRPVAVLLNDGRGNFTESSPQAYLTAFSTSEIFLVALSTEIRDASGDLSLRYPLGECDEAARDSVPRSVAGWSFREVAFTPKGSVAASFFGRAPPSAGLSS